METSYYVATDANGVERFGGVETAWTLPDAATGQPTPLLRRPDGERLVLRRPLALLDCLDDVISRAEAEPESPPPSDPDGTWSVGAARLVVRTTWQPHTAALFAIDCASHALGDSGDVLLPGGHRIDSVLEDARRCVTEATDAETHLGLLARLATLRRLRKQGRSVGSVAFGLSIEDIEHDLDATLDPAWLTASSVADAVLAALEALRHVAAPRYVEAREERAAEQASRAGDAVTSAPYTTPWGPITFGAEHESPYMAASIAAREAALRAREVLGAQSGPEAEADERSWQASRLADALGE